MTYSEGEVKPISPTVGNHNHKHLNTVEKDGSGVSGEDEPATTERRTTEELEKRVK